MSKLITLEEELRSSPEVTKEDVKAVLEWTTKQPHLPQLEEDEVSEIMAVYMAIMIKRRYMSVERAKETFDNFWTFKTIVPEIYANRNIHTPELKYFFASSYNMIMDKRDYDGNIVVVHYPHKNNPEKYDLNGDAKGIFMGVESWYYENGSSGAPGLTAILDQRNFTLSHLARMPLSTVKKINYYNKECAPLSVKRIYVVNATKFIHTILSVFKPLLHGELFNKIKTFTPEEMDQLYKLVPKEALPDEYGGTAGTLQHLNGVYVKRMERCQEIFKKLDGLAVDESKRMGPQKNDSNMFGLEGSFKKLNVD